jgi:nucleoside-diphosphate-sugar epimerase
MKKILILGVNGFIGHHLSRTILAGSDWQIWGMDMQDDRVRPFLGDPRFHFFEGDITINHEWVEYHIRKCDLILPLVAIATPATYVREPLRVFELDFEANLPLIRQCVKYRKRVIFPSTSEVYGMCADGEFHPQKSNLVLGPIDKQRWIYSCSKQLMDRIIWAYGQRDGLDFTLIRPFNWVGSGLDSLATAKEGSSRVATQFLAHIARGEDISLVDGGRQRRCFTHINDGIDAVMRIIRNEDGIATGKIYNIGNPVNDLSIRQLAERMIEIGKQHPAYARQAQAVRIREVGSAEFYGKGYEDVQTRVPWIENTCADLGWMPRAGMDEILNAVFDAYAAEVTAAAQLLDTGPTHGHRAQG